MCIVTRDSGDGDIQKKKVLGSANPAGTGQKKKENERKLGTATREKEYYWENKVSGTQTKVPGQNGVIYRFDPEK